MRDTENVLITREDLYRMVWSEPVMTIVKTYDLSDRGLAKICAKMEIPVPGRGYWRRKQTGRRVSIPPLPQLSKQSHHSESVYLRKLINPAEKAPREPERRQEVLFEKMPENKIHVSSSLDDPHPLVTRTEKALRKAKPEMNGLTRPSLDGCLDVYVAPNSIDRSMRIMDAFLKALKARGFSVTRSADSQFFNSVNIMGEVLKFSLVEKYRKLEKELTKLEKMQREKESWRYYPKEYYYTQTGLLSLCIDNEAYHYLRVRKTWNDGIVNTIETSLNSVIIGLRNMAEAMIAERERRKREEIERQRIEALQLELKKRRIEEEARIKRLRVEISDWIESRQIRSYIDDLKISLAENGRVPEAGSELDLWLTWAGEYADKIDPFSKLKECLPADTKATP